MIARTTEEYEGLRESGRRLGEYLKRLSAMVAPGVTPRELDTTAREMIESGGDVAPFAGYPSGRGGTRFPGVICISVNDAIVHAPGTLSTIPFEEGDLVTLDFGVSHKGFITDAARTVIVGTPHDPKEVEMLRVAYEALDAGIAQAKAGNRTGDIGHAVEQFAKKYGYGFPLHLAGHGVGRELHEDPHVPNYGAPGTGDRLVDGMVIAIEPMFTLGTGETYVDKDGFTYRTKDGSRTVHVEQTVIIGKDGAEVITRV